MVAPDFTATKRCAKCGKEKPRSEFHKDKKRPDGLYPWCKTCKNTRTKTSRAYKAFLIRKRAAYRENPEPFRQANRDYRAANPEKVRQWEKTKWQKNGDKIRRRRRAIRWKNRHVINAILRADWKANRAKRTLAKRKHYRLNRESMLQKNRKLYAAHPEWWFAGALRRRARKRGLPADWTQADAEFARKWFKGVCPLCGGHLGLITKMHWDHWIPLADPECPGTVPQNMLPLCNDCNLEKNRRPAEDYAKELLGKKAKRRIARILAFFRSCRQVPHEFDRHTGHQTDRKPNRAT